MKCVPDIHGHALINFVTKRKYSCLIIEASRRNSKEENPLDIESVYVAYVDDVYRFVLSLCRNPQIAEDITSDTFLKAIKAIDKFKGDCSLRVWLCQIAKNAYFNYVKRNKHIAEMPVEVPSYDQIEEKLSDNSQAMEVHRALHQMGEPYKEVFSLRVFSELSFSQIGTIFGKSDGWARVTFHRAKNMLKEGISK